jgi:hypothetical protein
MMQMERAESPVALPEVRGEFVDLDGERYYAIRNVDRMPPFLVSVVSSDDHWLFVSSYGGLTAGRVSPDTALFPYVTVDKVHESAPHTGCKTLLRVAQDGSRLLWEPFNREQDGQFRLTRNLYKGTLGDKLCFEEVNHDLGLAFRYTWATSARHGFVRRCELTNLRGGERQVELLDGLQNVLPAGTSPVAQAGASNLVNAYKWTELDAGSGLAMYALYSQVSDRAEPAESLRANVVYGLGLDAPTVLVSSVQLDDFRRGAPIVPEQHRRGIRGAYFLATRAALAGGGSLRWQLVADIERTQGQVVDLIRQLADPARLQRDIDESVAAGSDELARIVASADGFQAAREEEVTAHHYANVLFNVMRGGIFVDQYRVPAAAFARSVRHFNRPVYDRHRGLLGTLGGTPTARELLAVVEQAGDPQLTRLCYEYLPITFGRRHGDPSRPWNRFSIRPRQADGRRPLHYEGNWRDIFQNWEALTLSYPEFIEYVVAKFVNASTVDGFNPYRITAEGIDWEVEEPGNPWSHIGYWGDHQIIYLLRLLELSRQFHPDRLRRLLRTRVYSYASVPYRIRSFEELVRDPKRTVDYDHGLAARIAARVAAMGADGKLVVDASDQVVLVNLAEKLLVPLLSKLGNFVVDGGIWLNTQRPEWNDANNALVGHGLSMVTVYHLRRYVSFLRELLGAEGGTLELSAEVADWLAGTAAALGRLRPLLGGAPVDATQRWRSMEDLGSAASRYRSAVYAGTPLARTVQQPVAQVMSLLDDALAAIDHTIRTNLREDGAYHAYNLLDISPGAVVIDRLYLMLEGQVAALSSGAMSAAEASSLVESLFESEIYRADQQSFMLYPDRPLPGFLEKNRVPAEAVESIPLLPRMIDAGDTRVISRDATGCYRFNADFSNVGDLDTRLDALREAYGHAVDESRAALRDLYEDVFRHREFTGRSGTMFGFEGLGCIYWHMVSKLLLSLQENFFQAVERGAGDEATLRLARLYYRVRDGLGFNKGPAEYGAFPTDPYSHTTRHSGARQPGMTGQVKEEVLSRFGELGLRVADGRVRFEPRLLRECEFPPEARPFRYLDVDGTWQVLTVPAGGLAFTWCQVPVVYRLSGRDVASLVVSLGDGDTRTMRDLSLPAELSGEIFRRSGSVRQVIVDLPRRLLLDV